MNPLKQIMSGDSPQIKAITDNLADHEVQPYSPEFQEMKMESPLSMNLNSN